MITALTVYIFTNETALSVEIGIADSAIKIIIYYSHERLWNRANIGRRKDAQQDYVI